MSAYTYGMPTGFAGEVSRKAGATVESAQVGDSPLSFGQIVKLKNGKLCPLAGGDTAKDVYGVVTRSYPSTGEGPGYGPNQVAANSICGVLRRGYISVSLSFGTAAKGGAVYVRTVTSGERTIGNIEAVADAENSFALAACLFMGDAGSGEIIEIAYNI